MKRLLLLRHAKSGWDDPATRDFDRPLNPRGRRAARVMAAEITANGAACDAIIASPARRVVETIAELVAEGVKAPVRYDERAYLAAPGALIELIRGADPESATVMLVGHNPGIEKLAMLLSRDDGGRPRRELAAKYPTAALAEIVLAIDGWDEIGPGKGELRRFVRPRDLDPALGPED